MAKNMKRENNWRVNVVVSYPASPVSGDPVRFGPLTGVALTDEGGGGNAATETSVDFGPRSWLVSVKGIDDAGNSAVADGDPIYFVDESVPLSKKASGYFFGIARGTVSSGATTAITVDHVPMASNLAGIIGASDLTTTMRTGFIPLNITELRIIAGDVIGNTTEGMLLDGNTAPSLQRVNGATDKALRVIWASSSSVECQFPPVAKPPDLDGTALLSVHLMLEKDTNTDTAVTIDIQIFDGVGDTEAGGATAALAAAALAEYSASIAAADLAEHPGFLNISLVPGAHTTDAIRLYAAWIEYTRK